MVDIPVKVSCVFWRQKVGGWCMSDKAYHEIRMALPQHVRAQVPPLASLLRERRKQSGEINIINISDGNTSAKP